MPYAKPQYSMTLYSVFSNKISDANCSLFMENKTLEMPLVHNNIAWSNYSEKYLMPVTYK